MTGLSIVLFAVVLSITGLTMAVREAGEKIAAAIRSLKKEMSRD